jgi:nicotinamidase-related amidase
LQYLRQKRKRFVLTAGLVTSVCVFLTTASAAQNGFLTPTTHARANVRHVPVHIRTDDVGSHS